MLQYHHEVVVLAVIMLQVSSRCGSPQGQAVPAVIMLQVSPRGCSPQGQAVPAVFMLQVSPRGGSPQGQAVPAGWGTAAGAFRLTEVAFW